MRYREFMTEASYYYVGNCTDSFDPDSGECNLGIFNDVSDFAYHDENAAELLQSDFESFVSMPEELRNLALKYDVKYLSYDNRVLAFYVEPVWDDNNNKDPNTDIHYFFKKL